MGRFPRSSAQTWARNSARPSLVRLANLFPSNSAPRALGLSAAMFPPRSVVLCLARCRGSSASRCQRSLAMLSATSSATTCPSSTASTTPRRSASPSPDRAASPFPDSSAARFLGNSARLLSPPTASRRFGQNPTTQPTTSPRPGEAKTQPTTSQRLKEKEKEKTQTRTKLVSHGVQTVLACSSQQHIADYLLPIYKCNFNKCHSQSEK